MADDMRNIIRRFLETQRTSLLQYLTIISDIESKYRIWKPKRQDVIGLVDKQIKEFSLHRRNVNIANVVGSSVSLASGAACITGLMLAPVTGGLSVVLTGGGMAMFAAGTATAVGADVVEHVIKRKDLKKLKEAIEEDSVNTLELLSLVENSLSQEEQFLVLFKQLFEETLGRHIHVLEEWIDFDITDFATRAALFRIREDRACIADYMHILFLFCNNHDCTELQHIIHNIQNASSNADAASRVLSAVSGVGVNFWLTIGRLGEGTFLTSLKTAAKSAKLASGLVLGLSMLVDAYCIKQRSDEIKYKKITKEVENLKKLLTELKKQKEDISQYFDGAAN